VLVTVAIDEEPVEEPEVDAEAEEVLATPPINWNCVL